MKYVKWGAIFIIVMAFIGSIGGKKKEEPRPSEASSDAMPDEVKPSRVEPGPESIEPETARVEPRREPSPEAENTLPEQARPAAPSAEATPLNTSPPPPKAEALVEVDAVKVPTPEPRAKVEEAPPEPAVPTMTAAQLMAAYEANEVAADERFKDMVIEVSGRIADIGKDFSDVPYVTLGTGRQFREVKAYFDDPSPIGGMKKRQPITLRCESAGRSVMNVVLNHCIIAK